MQAILAGVRVLDLSRVLAGPYCAQMLADQGATVIKVESPDGGDENRQWGARAPDGTSCNFHSVNRGKRSIALNLKSAAARDVLHRFVARSDVMIQSFLPDSAARLGIDYERVREINPGIVYCSISGYGEHGDMNGKAGYDLMMQAFSGIMSTTGFEDGPPVRAGVSFIDLSTGITAYGGIVTALLRRQAAGVGSHVRCSLLETAVSLLGYHAVSWLQAGVLPRKEGSGVWHLVPYQAFLCRDGWLLAGATNDAAWRRFCMALGALTWIADPRFATVAARLEHKAELLPLLETAFASNTVAYWMERFDAEGVAASPLHTLDRTLSHPQVLANGMVVQVTAADGRAMPVLGPPFKIAGAEATATRAAPLLGADTEPLLREELGMDDAAISALRAAGAL